MSSDPWIRIRNRTETSADLQHCDEVSLSHLFCILKRSKFRADAGGTKKNSGASLCFSPARISCFPQAERKIAAKEIVGSPVPGLDQGSRISAHQLQHCSPTWKYSSIILPPSTSMLSRQIYKFCCAYHRRLSYRKKAIETFFNILKNHRRPTEWYLMLSSEGFSNDFENQRVRL